MGENEPIKWGDDGGEPESIRPEDMPVSAEVVRRVRKVTKQDVAQAKEDYVSLEWDDVFPKKPAERLRWLYKACIAAKAGKLKPNPLFNIVSHRKFIDGLKGSIATDVLNLIRGNLTLFSAKQQKQLTSDNFELFKKYAPINVLDSDDDEADAPPLPPPPEVIIEPKDKKKKQREAEARRREQDDESEDGASDDDTDTKRRRLLSKGVERRVDPSDGQAYTIVDFITEYGGTVDRPPIQWVNSRHTAFTFKE